MDSNPRSYAASTRSGIYWWHYMYGALSSDVRFIVQCFYSRPPVYSAWLSPNSFLFWYLFFWEDWMDKAKLGPNSFELRGNPSDILIYRRSWVYSEVYVERQICCLGVKSTSDVQFQLWGSFHAHILSLVVDWLVSFQLLQDLTSVDNIFLQRTAISS